MARQMRTRHVPLNFDDLCHRQEIRHAPRAGCAVTPPSHSLWWQSLRSLSGLKSGEALRVREYQGADADVRLSIQIDRTLFCLQSATSRYLVVALTIRNSGKQPFMLDLADTLTFKVS